MDATDDRRAQIPYAPYRIETCASGGRVRHPASGRSHTMNEDAVRLLACCDGYHTMTEIMAYIIHQTRLPPGEIEPLVARRLAELSQEGLVWWRAERVRGFRLPPPSLVYLDVTGRCNLHCAHCGVSAGEPLDGELSTAEWLDVIGQLAQSGVQSVAFSGGEPLLRPDLPVLLARAHEDGLQVALSTNGTCINGETATWLRQLVDQVQVSLDAATPEAHDAFRGRRGAFEAAVRGMGHLHHIGMPFVVGSVIHRRNLHDVEALAQLAHSLGASSLRLIHFVPFGRGSTSPELEPSPIELRQLAAEVRAIRTDSPLEITEVNFEFLFQLPEPLNAETLQGPIGCGGALSSLTITAQGKVLPCSFLAGMSGDNMRSRSFAEIWQSSRLLNYWRSLRLSDISGKCQQCRWLATCKAGCPAANFAHGCMLKPHVHCFLTPEEAARGEPISNGGA